MNLKLRYTLLFNFFVATILLSSCITIYISYKNFREKDFKLRLTNKATSFQNDLNSFAGDDSLSIKLINNLNANNLNDEHLTLVDANYNIIYNLPNNSVLDYVKDSSIYKKLIKDKSYYAFLKDKELVALYSDENKTYVFASAVDITGFRKLKNLFAILITVFLFALIISIITTFLFVVQAFKPLIKLSSQIQETTVLNLTAKIDEGKGNNEINNIAKNFNAMLQRLNNAFENQKTFVQNASHELRTPLATMLSQTEAAINRNLDKEGYKKILISLKEEQTNLIELTNSLLLISQYDKIVFQDSWPKERVDEILYDTIATCKRIFNNIDITLDFKTLPENEAELLIVCDDTLLKSAFRNLIKNAYNYSNNQKVTIVIEIDKTAIQVIFTNTGNQLTCAEIDKIKMPFFRGQNAINKKGFGLGLSIVNKIIELHKGSIIYKAIDDNINQFSITLPIA